MAPGFARSISPPLSPSHKKASYHVRSVNLPCRSHPLISKPGGVIGLDRSRPSADWTASHSLEWVSPTFPNSRDLGQAVSVNQLLDDLLQLVDFYGLFLSNIDALKQCNSEVQSALRRQDRFQMASSLRTHQHVEKQMAQFVSGLRGMTKCKHLPLSSDAKELEMAGIIVEAICATAFASMAVFMGAGALSAPASSTKMRSSFLKKRSCDVEKDIQALEKWEGLEERIRNIEFISERVYKGLINSRISLLDISTFSL